MRSVRLAQVAAQAEWLRLRRMARRQAARVVFAAIALTFVLACLAAVHVAGFFALRRADIAPIWCALIVAGVDLLIALVFLLVASRDSPGAVEREALQVRETAQAQLLETAALAGVAGPLLRTLGVRKVYALALAALTARYLGGLRR